MDAVEIGQVRSFNRTVAERIGALDGRYLRRARPLGEARLIWEIGLDGAEVRALRARMGLDSGYLSRVLRALERQGLVKVSAGPGDGRVRQACLTEEGLAERAELDRRSDALAAGILETLSDRQRQALLAAMAEIDRLLQASMVDFAVENPASAEAKWCLSQYFAELDRRFDGGYDPAAALPATESELRPPAGAFVIARLRGQAVGCGGLKLHGKEPAELKRMWIAPAVRGLGVGRRLLAELEGRARAAGAARVRLETNRALTEAIRLYRSAGYVEVEAFNEEPYGHHWFEKRVR
jgi:DNA-binding MarR family transcriptional regulator/N-acetylglutamate synthase-like GNAT family acetyltransferase